MSVPAGVVDGLLAGRYRLSSRLAAGAMGEVWRARDLLLDRDVAVKTLRPELADDPVVRQRFRAEARSAGRLAHPGIAAVYDVGEDDGRAWIVLELVEGESLQSVLRREGRLGPEQTLDVVVQTATALQAAHDGGVVHRDVKPGNMLVREDGVLKVTDFGIASVAGTARLTGTGQVVGTAAYLSPEQAGGGEATPASDLYSLGVVAYECLSGTVPFAFETPVAVVLAHLRTEPPPLPADVPAPLRQLVIGLLAKDPQERPASARALVVAAEAVRDHLRGGAPASPTVPPAAPTAVLPQTGPAPLPVGDLPPLAPGRPPLVSRRAQAAGLSGRPGQRWAVRATALLLGLLAVALGVRQTSSRPDPAPSPAPSGAATTAPSPAPSGVGTAPVPPAVPAQPPPAQPPPAQEQPQPAPPVGQEGGASQVQEPAEDAAERAEDAADEAADRAEDKADKAEDKGEGRRGEGRKGKGEGRGGSSGKGGDG